MKVTIEMTQQEVREYVNSDYPVSESEYPELICGDIKTLLRRAGFNWVELGDVTVTITNA
ncbi:hypothetical protein [Xenorhabdus littoralis]|uniref:hypothetical protein n=1 Tax=Xenorhabdus littoralis TaxID=2582835 RepID=UPI0029E7F8F4|nr:hypothetical protein [Xenorhabdus sp. psl]MDX7992631.1 hypothetical protein [Xenorhabdus sp. psl]